MICHENGFNSNFHSDVIMTSVNFNNWRLKSDVSFDLEKKQQLDLIARCLNKRKTLKKSFVVIVLSMLPVTAFLC